jgi:hypothetical protein
MTDRAVQPEAPTTEAGRQMLDALFADSGRPFLRDVWVANILDIEAEARAASEERPQPDRQQLNDEYMRGYRAASLMLDSLIEVERAGVAQERYNMDFETPDEVTASQERPQPPLHGHQYGGDWVECTDEHPGVAQERPQPDEWLRGVQACIDHGHYLTIEDVGVAQERPQPPLHGHQYGGDWVECTDEHPGVAQERPHPCADCAEDAFTGSGRGICAYHEAAAQERPSTETTPIDVQRDD